MICYTRSYCKLVQETQDREVKIIYSISTDITQSPRSECAGSPFFLYFFLGGGLFYNSVLYPLQ